jgi:hypothetical protein
MPVPTSPATRSVDDPSALAFRTFLAVADRLGLAVRERLALLGIARSTYTVWRRRLGQDLGNLKPDQVDRLACVLGIYERAGRIFPDGVAWLTRANRAPAFRGRRPLDRMLDGRMEDLIETLSYLLAPGGG